MARKKLLITVLEKSRSEVLDDWVKAQLGHEDMRSDLIDEAELKTQSRKFLDGFSAAAKQHGTDSLEGERWDDLRAALRDLSRTRAEQGFSSTETATFVFSLKEPLFRALQEGGGDMEAVLVETWALTELLDQLGLYTMEHYQAGREAVIRRQQTEILELSTPVVELWEGVVAVPLIGTLDSERTQTVMENLLEAIVANGATVAIIDITGVPAVDTLVAQHLIKTVAAARLMGAECIISGIRPQIAQTIVHLGIELEGVATKASLADAISLAFRRLDLQITRRTT
jgi:rsbT co-antagonist protein RsbR